MTNAAVYARISKDNDGTALGVKRQQDDCQALCERHGWNVVEVIVDNDESAYTGRTRPGYARLLDGIEHGVFDTVVAWHPDRLHRNPRELEDFIDLVERSGATVQTCTAGEYDLATPEGRLHARIVGSVARKESEDKSRRLRRKHVELAEAGKVSGGGRRPFGYEADRLTIRNDEAELIREAAAKVLGGASIRSIVVDWRNRGVQTVTGAAWQPTTVKRLLMSARIAGQRSHHGRVVGDAEWPAIIDPDEALRLRAVLSVPKQSQHHTNERSALLAGLIRCGRCGQQMNSAPIKRKGHRYRRYACHPDRGGCGRCGIGAERLEDLVVDAVFAALDTPDLAETIRARQEKADDGAVVDAVAEIEARQADLAEMFAEGEITRSEWSTARDRLDAKLAEARQALAEVEVEHARPVIDAGLAERWGDLDLAGRRAVLGTVLEAVEIAPVEHGTVNRFDPDRVSLVWKA